MTQKEREKAEQYLYIVGWVLNKYQLYNNTNPNMGYDDLYQEGCIALCKAVQRFDAAKGSHMNAFAFTVVRNHIFAYCKKISMKRRTMSLSELTETKYASYFFDDTRVYILQILQEHHKKSDGIFKKGIEVIFWKMCGYENKDIAKMYHVKNNEISAWLSRAISKLKKSKQFLDIAV